MTINEHKTAALRTETDYVAYRKNVSRSILARNFMSMLRTMVCSANLADRWKRLMFYGKPPEKGERSLFCTDETAAPETISKLQEENVRRLIHVAMGLYTEAGEVMEAVLAYITHGTRKPLDAINIAEEFGDAHWYLSLGADVVRRNPEEILEANIAKLRARYPEAFNALNATVRNLDRERAVLEGKC